MFLLKCLYKKYTVYIDFLFSVNYEINIRTEIDFFMCMQTNQN